MSKKENKHPYIIGTEHGNLSFGKVNTQTNEISACMLQNGPDGGRHYIKMEEPGDKEEGTKGSTKIFSEKTVDMIGRGLLNIYGGLCDFADRSTKNLPSKTGGEELSSNEGINR